MLLIGLVVMLVVWVGSLRFVLFCCLCLFKCSLFVLVGVGDWSGVV